MFILSMFIIRNVYLSKIFLMGLIIDNNLLTPSPSNAVSLVCLRDV